MIKKTKINIIKLQKGNIIKCFDFNKKFLKNFEEIYFSEIKRKFFKGWKFHKNRNQLMTISSGIVDFYFKKNENGKVKRIRVSYPNNLYLLHVPKKMFYCFKCVSKKDAMIVNIIDEKNAFK